MERLLRLEELRKEIAIGIEHSEQGDIFDGEEVIRELRQEIRQSEQGA
jgi:antitoxin ParD1/3/4